MSERETPRQILIGYDIPPAYVRIMAQYLAEKDLIQAIANPTLREFLEDRIRYTYPRTQGDRDKIIDYETIIKKTANWQFMVRIAEMFVKTRTFDLILRTIPPHSSNLDRDSLQALIILEHSTKVDLAKLLGVSAQELAEMKQSQNQ